jgi:hypothetical protein
MNVVTSRIDAELDVCQMLAQTSSAIPGPGH